MAHIEKRGPNRYRARYRDPSGKERSKTFARKVDAERFVSTNEADKARGTWLDPRLARTGYEEWAAQWLKTTVHLKPKTQAGYESLLRSHVLPRFGAETLGGIRANDVKAWVAKMDASGLSPSRIRQAYQVFAATMEAAEQSGYIGRSPCVGVAIPREKRREMRFLSSDEINQLATTVPPEYRTLILTLAYAGIRWGEAVSLRVGRCDPLRRRIRITESLAEVGGDLHFGPTKTYQNRMVALPPFLSELLAEHIKRSYPKGTPDPKALVFSSPAGDPLRNSNFRNRVWLPALQSLGWGEWVVVRGKKHFKPSLRIHDLRHTCAALLIAQKAHPKAIQTHLGHSSITVTLDRYGHLFPDEMDRLAEGLGETYRESAAPATATAD